MVMLCLLIQFNVFQKNQHYQQGLRKHFHGGVWWWSDKKNLNYSG